MQSIHMTEDNVIWCYISTQQYMNYASETALAIF